MAIDKDVLDQMLAGREPQELFARDGLLDELKKALSERMLSAELDDHLEAESAEGTINRRNGSSRKTMLTGTSKVTLDVPRDRTGTFDPKLIAKYQRRFPDFDDKIVSMYARYPSLAGASTTTIPTSSCWRKSSIRSSACCRRWSTFRNPAWSAASWVSIGPQRRDCAFPRPATISRRPLIASPASTSSARFRTSTTRRCRSRRSGRSFTWVITVTA
jgi:hypothetical protein